MIVRLHTTDPYRNLAVEERLLDSIDLYGPSLVLWRNDPCVVIGRHQNPWVECDLQAMRAEGVRLVRRISGGGAVYHDGGNTNFSFIAPGEHYDQRRHFDVVIAALATLGIEAVATERNDLRVGDRKISGNAFRHTRGSSLHHGTLLVAADLDRLTAYLTPRAARIETKAIASVRSTVTNLSEARPGLTHEELWDALSDAFAAEYGESAAGAAGAMDEAGHAIAGRAAELAGWEWLYGHTPAFVRRLEAGGAGQVALRVRKGRIAAVESDIPMLDDTLVGMRYHRTAIRELAARSPDEMRGVLFAIAEEID